MEGPVDRRNHRGLNRGTAARTEGRRCGTVRGQARGDAEGRGRDSPADREQTAKGCLHTRTPSGGIHKVTAEACKTQKGVDE